MIRNMQMKTAFVALGLLVVGAAGCGEDILEGPLPNPEFNSTGPPPDAKGPAADAGVDQTANEGAAVTLRGGNSADRSGNPLSYEWLQLSGPQVSISGVFSAEASFVALEVTESTELEFELTVTDGSGLSDTDTVTITIININHGNRCDDVDCPSGYSCVAATGDCVQVVDLCGDISCPDGEGCNANTGVCEDEEEEEEEVCGDGVCNTDENADNCPADCEPEEFCGDSVCNTDENADNCPADCEAFERFYELVDQAKPDRASDNPVGEEIQTGDPYMEETVPGQTKVVFTDIEKRHVRGLTNLVMMDNTIGKIYPGSLLWAAAVRDGQLHQLAHMPNRPPITTSFNLLESIDPEPSALIFTHDGTYSSFMSGAAGVFGATATGGTRLVATLKTSSSIDDALLSIGLSAKYWSGKVTAGLEHITNEQRSVAMMSLDQVFYSASVDTPSIGGFVPPSLLQNDARLASVLAQGAASGGEIAYVRKVDYGRRILVSLSSESTSDKLKMALDWSIKYAAGETSGEIDNETKKVWESIEGKLIIIGGSYPAGVTGFFGGDPEAFKQTIQAIMSPDFVNDTDGAVPLSFELAYVDDNAPMQVYETVEFSGKIPTRTFGRVIRPWVYDESDRGPLTSGQHASAIGPHDGEVGHDDCTLVELRKQELTLSPDRRTLYFYVEWYTKEARDDCTPNDTIIRSLRTILVETFPKPVLEIVSPTSIGSLQQSYGDYVQGQYQSFPNHGLLTNIGVQFDGSGGNDQQYQKLKGTLNVELWLEE